MPQRKQAIGLKAEYNHDKQKMQVSVQMPDNQDNLVEIMGHDRWSEFVGKMNKNKELTIAGVLIQLSGDQSKEAFKNIQDYINRVYDSYQHEISRGKITPKGA